MREHMRSHYVTCPLPKKALNQKTGEIDTRMHAEPSRDLPPPPKILNQNARDAYITAFPKKYKHSTRSTIDARLNACPCRSMTCFLTQTSTQPESRTHIHQNACSVVTGPVPPPQKKRSTRKHERRKTKMHAQPLHDLPPPQKTLDQKAHCSPDPQWPRPL